MTLRRATESRTDAVPTTGSTPAEAPAPAQRPAQDGAPGAPSSPRSPEEAEARYAAARDEWTAAMRAANSGRAADLASLAMAQEAYEEATAEVRLWRSGEKVAIPIQPERNHAGLQAAIGQELAWRRMQEPKPKQVGPLFRLVRKITRRG